MRWLLGRNGIGRFGKQPSPVFLRSLAPGYPTDDGNVRWKLTTSGLVQWTRAEISSGKTCLLLPDPSDLPRRVPIDYRAYPSLAGLPHAARPHIRFLYVESEISSSAFFRSPLARGTLA